MFNLPVINDIFGDNFRYSPYFSDYGYPLVHTCIFISSKIFFFNLSNISSNLPRFFRIYKYFFVIVHTYCSSSTHCVHFYLFHVILQSYYQPYMVGLQQGGQLQQYAAVGGTAAPAAAANPSVGPYSYFQYGPASAAAAGGPYSMVQYPQLYQYAAAVAAGATAAPTTLAAGVVAGGLQQYGGAVAFTPNSIAQAAGKYI